MSNVFFIIYKAITNLQLEICDTCQFVMDKQYVWLFVRASSKVIFLTLMFVR